MNIDKDISDKANELYAHRGIGGTFALMLCTALQTERNAGKLKLGVAKLTTELALLKRAERAERERDEALHTYRCVEEIDVYRALYAEHVALKRKLAEERDCGQTPGCAVPPGCGRHWGERNRELLAERDEARRVARVLAVTLDHLVDDDELEAQGAGELICTALAYDAPKPSDEAGL